MEQEILDLLQEVTIQEKSYNWIEAAKLYERIAKRYSEGNVIDSSAEIYEKLGYVYSRAIRAANSKEDYRAYIIGSINAYRAAEKNYKQINNTIKELECKAEIYFVNSFTEMSLKHCIESLKKASEKFMEICNFYLKDNDKENHLRLLYRLTECLISLFQYLDTQYEIENTFQKGIEVLEKGWNLSFEIEKMEYIAYFLWAETLFQHGMNLWMKNRINDEKITEYNERLLSKCKKAINIVEKSGDDIALSMVYLSSGFPYIYFSSWPFHKGKEQQDFADEGLKYLEKALDSAEKCKDHELRIFITFYLNYYAAILGRFQYVQKRILNDITKLQKIAKIFENKPSISRFLLSFLYAYYYQDFAQRSFLNSSQRISYANKGIKQIEYELENKPFGPLSVWSYQILTNLYSQLVILTTNKEERQTFINKMFEYAKAAETKGKTYRGGITRSSGYMSIYRAYKTLSDISLKKEEKIKNLSVAIEAAKENINYSVESYKNFIGTQIRLGLLYEELAILTGQTDPLSKAKELFLFIIKDTSEKEYYYHTAAAFEYIARIADRLGNHLESAEYYKKASDAHLLSLQSIEFKLLKDHVKEKIEYTNAWNLIEIAKANHKKGNHLIARENYRNACEILKNLASYKYENTYYSSWALLEEAEYLSREEKHKEAIEQYHFTKTQFENAINILRKELRKASNVNERERINKLEKC